MLEEEWLTVVQAAEVTGYHPDTIRRLVRSGKIRARKWGRDWQVSRKGLMAYIELIANLGEKRGPKTQD